MTSGVLGMNASKMLLVNFRCRRGNADAESPVLRCSCEKLPVAPLAVATSKLMR